MSLQDWLTHEDVNLAVYFPMFQAVGMNSVEVSQPILQFEYCVLLLR